MMIMEAGNGRKEFIAPPDSILPKQIPTFSPAGFVSLTPQDLYAGAQQISYFFAMQICQAPLSNTLLVFRSTSTITRQ